MNIPINIWMWLLAILPIVILLYLMVGKQWGANKAAPLGILIALFNAFVFYKANLTLVLSEVFKGLWSSFSVLLVVWTAIILYEIVRESKAFIVFRNGLKRVTPNELIQIIAIGWVFTSFLQGITGFGVPVAVGAPLLLGLGVRPIYAVIISLLGQAWAGTYGTLAIAWDALVVQTNIGENPTLLYQTAMWATIFIWLFNFISGIAICWLYGRKAAVKKGFLAILVISIIQGGGQVLMSQINPTLACFVPTVVALISIFILSKVKTYRHPWRIVNSPIMSDEKTVEVEENYPQDMNIHQAFFPYYVLTFMTLFVLLITPIRKFLEQWKIGFNFSETKTGYGFINQAAKPFSPFAPLTHAGLFLILAAIIGFIYYKKKGWIKPGGSKAVLNRTWRKSLPSSIAVIGFIVMSRIMGGSGQVLVLAQGFAKILGQAYILFAPLVGLLGSFMTSSNMASNILFGQFQLTTASLLDIDTALILGAQTAGGSIGNALSPGSVILGATTAGIIGQEGKILKKIIPITLGVAIFIGLISFIMMLI